MPEALKRLVEAEPFRMIAWLVIAFALYTAAIFVGPNYPLIQVPLTKYANVTGLAWAGYWVARTALGRVDVYSDDDELVARAIVIGATLIAGSLGL